MDSPLNCPHCNVVFLDNAAGFKAIPKVLPISRSAEDVLGCWLSWRHCTNCRRVIISVRDNVAVRSVIPSFGGSEWLLASSGKSEQRFVVPRHAIRKQIAESIPGELRRDYEEACLVLGDSTRASAALSRRCLQGVLELKGGVERGIRLAKQIERVLASKELPPYICDRLHYVRELGNVGAHPTNNACTGEILDVEPGEAEACLLTIESLFDFYFTAPEKAAKETQELERKIGRKIQKPR